MSSRRRVSGSESRSIEYGVVHLAFDIEPTGASLAASDAAPGRPACTASRESSDPSPVAVIGAGRNPSSIGHAVLRNLDPRWVQWPVYPVNPNVEELLGLTCAPSVEAIEGQVDLAVLAIPASRCASKPSTPAPGKGFMGLVVITSGFAEIGASRRRLAGELLLRAHRGGMRVVGPNCFGVINTAPDVSMNTTFASQVAGARQHCVRVAIRSAGHRHPRAARSPRGSVFRAS